MLESRLTRSLVAKLLSLAVYANFMLQAKNTANKATDGCLRNFNAGCSGA